MEAPLTTSSLPRRKLKVMALTFGDASCASTFYRICQMQQPLEHLGVDLNICEANRFSSWNSLSSYDAVIVQKRLFSTGTWRTIRKYSRVLIYDTDDAVWEPHGPRHSFWTRWRTERRLRDVARLADICLAPNSFLTEALRSRGAKVLLHPMALEEAIWQPSSSRHAGPVRVGWAGAPVNLPYFNHLAPIIKHAATADPTLEWVVYCGQPPQLPKDIVITHVPFKQGAEAACIQTFDIGLLPLPANDFASGKSPIKALQYMACGVPIISAPGRGVEEIILESNGGIVARSEAAWLESLLMLARSPEKRIEMGTYGRQHFLKHFSVGAASQRLVKILENYCNAIN